MPTPNLSPKNSRERGNIIVELSLALPLLLFMVAGALDLGSLFWEKHVLTNATREGARVAVKALNNGTNVVLDSGQFSYTWAANGSGNWSRWRFSKSPTG